MFSVAKACATKITIHNDEIIATCSDGLVRVWILPEQLGAIDEPDYFIKVSKKSLTSAIFLRQHSTPLEKFLIVADDDGTLFKTCLNTLAVTVRKKVHRGNSPEPGVGL